MATTADSARKAWRGTWGQLWRNGVKKANVTAFSAKIAVTREEVNLCGLMMTDSRPTKCKGTGTMTFYKTDSDDVERELTVLDGADVRDTLYSKLDDPDASGAEGWAFYGVAFDDITPADWANAKLGTVTKNFTFTAVKPVELAEEE